VKMASKARAVKTSKKDGGGSKGSKRDPPQKDEKTNSSGSSSGDEPEVKKSQLLKEKVDRPKKEKGFADRDDDEKSGRDEKKERDRDKRIMSEIEKKMEEKIRSWQASQKQLIKTLRKVQKEKNYEIEAMIREVKKSLSIWIGQLEKGLEISKVEVGRLRESLQTQLEDIQPAGKADDGWKEMEENLKNELKEIKIKLEKRIKKDEMENLKNEVSELKKLMEVKLKEVSTQYSTPVKGSGRPNNSGWKKDYHSPVHSPEVDWWKKKRKWSRPVWCGTHGWGAHTTSMCWKKKKIWRIKQVVEGELGGSPTASSTTKE